MHPLEYSPRQQRIFSVMDMLETRLQQDCQLADLARHACYSLHHFERAFGDQVGQTPMDYLRRRRLYQAAARARYERTALAQIGFDCGYGSKAAFAKAFRLQFGYSARAWRHGAWQAHMQDNLARSLAVDSAATLANLAREAEVAAHMPTYAFGDVLLCTVPAQPFWYRRWIGVAGYDLLQQMQRTLHDAATLGLWQPGVQHAAMLREDVGGVRVDQQVFDFGILPISASVSTPATVRPPAGLVAGRIPGGLYAGLPFHGALPVWRWLHEAWLEQQQVYTLDALRPQLVIARMQDGVEQGHFLLPIRRAR